MTLGMVNLEWTLRISRWYELTTVALSVKMALNESRQPQRDSGIKLRGV
jgi:hypothetical protein